MQRPTTPLRAGFSLIELVIAISILSIVAGIVAPRVSQFSEKARVTTAESDLKAMVKVLDTIREDMGVYPRDVSRGVDPGMASPTRVPSSRRTLWEGPYLDSWPAETPWKGLYDYEYWNYPDFDFDGTPGNEIVMSVRGGNMGASTLQALDAKMDDGDGSTGIVRHNGTNWLGMYVGEGPRW